MARGTRDTKIQVIEVSVSSLYISSLCLGRLDDSFNKTLIAVLINIQNDI